MPSIGPMELMIVLIIALVVFGPKKLPELGNSLGRGMREFKQSISADSTDGDRAAYEPVKAEADEVEVGPSTRHSGANA